MAATAANGNIADHVSGAKNAKVTMIEYGDFQCPACGSAYPKVKEINDEYKDKVTFIFRNNPLTTIHPNARAGAAAAEAAGLQGKYWEMHDILYEQQNDWSGLDSTKRSAIFETYAKQIGVKDINKFTADMASKAVNQKIDYDLALGKKIPVTATPTILINGKTIDSDTWSNKDSFKQAVEDALK